MRYRFSAWYFKLIAYILAVICIAGGFFTGFLTLWSDIQGYYDQPDSYFDTRGCYQTADSYASSLTSGIHFDDRLVSDLDRLLDGYEDTSFRYLLLAGRPTQEEDPPFAEYQLLTYYTEGLEVSLPKRAELVRILETYDRGQMTLAPEGEPFAGLYVGVSTVWTTLAQEVAVLDEDGHATHETTFEYTDQMFYVITLLDPSQPLTREFLEGQQLFETFYPLRYVLPSILAGCVLLLLALIVFLCCQAGRRPNEEGIKLSWLDKWPLDLLLVLAGAAFIAICFLFAVLYDQLWYYGYPFAALSNLDLIGIASGLSALCGLVVLAFLCSFFARFKAGKGWENSLVWKLGRWAWHLALRLLTWVWGYVKKPLGWVGRWLRRFFDVFPQAAKALPIAPRLIGCLLGLLAADFFLCLFARGFHSGFFLCLCVLYNGLLLAAAVYACGQLKRLWNAAEHLAKGELDFQLDTSKMYWDFKKHGDDLNAIAAGMNRAVDQRMKSERLKTELITNVSHDIKTPLTSIVNYVDLLQKPHTEAQQGEYLEVLDRQAKRLKRLTENLVEASKASTGNLPVSLEPTSVTEILSQAAEEYRERLEAGKLELVLTTGTDLTVLADGKLLWRVLDNLLGNVIKYALAGTRVYLSAVETGKTVTIAVKNISRESLNVNAEELMERFVRGDASRHAEGSGLGLNIAQSLTKLQNGQFRLTVDGDLFKAEIELPRK